MKPIKKILMLSHEFPPFGGGGGRVLSRLCEELAARDYGITVLTAAPPVEIRQQFPFKVVYFPTFRTARFKTSVPAMALYLAQVLLYCLRGKTGGHDFLFSNMSIPAGIAGIIVRKVLRLPHGIWYHGTEIHQNRPDGAGRLLRMVHVFIGKRASLNLFISKGLMDMARAYGRVPGMGVLPNAVAPFRDEKPSDLPSVSMDDGKLFLFVGRMEAVKGPMLLLEAVRILNSRGLISGMRVCLAGSGGLFKKVAREITRRDLGAVVMIEPIVPFERMAGFYRKSYALVLPSVVEGYPTSVLEAGALGVPAIASDTIGNRDAITHQETGLLFPRGDAEGLAAAMLRLARDPDLRDRLGKNARELSTKFSIKNTADVFIKVLEESEGARQ